LPRKKSVAHHTHQLIGPHPPINLDHIHLVLWARPFT